MIRQAGSTIVALAVVLGAAGAWTAEEQPFTRTIVGSESPSEIPFIEAARTYASQTLAVYDKNPRLGTQQVMNNFNVTADVAENFLSLLRTALAEYRKSGQQAMKNICSRRDELGTLQKIEAAFVDNAAAIDADLERDIRAAQARLEPNGKRLFEHHINNHIKKNMTVVQFDHKGIIQSRGETPSAVMARICDSPLAPTFQQSNDRSTTAKRIDAGSKTHE